MFATRAAPTNQAIAVVALDGKENGAPFKEDDDEHEAGEEGRARLFAREAVDQANGCACRDAVPWQGSSDCEPAMTSYADTTQRAFLDLEVAVATERESWRAQVAQLRDTADLRARHVQELQSQLADVTAERDKLRDQYAAALDHIADADREAEVARAECDLLRIAKDAAYSERNQCVAFMCKMARALGWSVWLGKHDPRDTAWENDWRNIVFIHAPTGQLSWHLHDSEMPLFDWVPTRPASSWDGHTTEEKYERMRRWRP